MSRRFGEIFHYGYVVPKLEEAMDYWINAMGVGPWFVETHDIPKGFIYRGKPVRTYCRVALAFSGPSYLELIEDTSPDETVNQTFLKDFPGGEIHVGGGLQHVGCMVDSVAELLADPEVASLAVLRGEVGPIQLAYLQPAQGAHPGTMIELIERGDYINRKIETIRAASVGWDGAEPIRAPSWNG